ncbi:MAG: hypothetical protein DRN30_04500 [Thermoplasmata archaeon]|nr:MAG: hypothetical protein DRN30_04500 [Thermoplasmata archaeon]
MEGINLNGLTTGVVFKDKETGRPEGVQPGSSEEKLKKACADFEAIFINYMMKTMRNTIPKSGLNNFPGKDIYATMVDQKVAQDLATKKGGIGLQEILLRRLGGS